MVKRIGKALILCLLTIYPISAKTSIALSITDQNGRSTNQVQVGIPFFVEAIISGEDTNVGSPTVEGIKAFHIQDQGLVSTIRTTINGVTTNKKVHRYLLRADKEGSFSVGPAIIHTPDGILKSGTAYITVSAQQQSSAAQEAAVRLLINKNRVVAGEKVEFVIRFYYQNGVSLIGISDPEIKDISLQGPYTGSEILNGSRMNYLEWRADLYPAVVGKMSIAPVRATYRTQRSNRSAGFDFFSLFDNPFDQKNVYSNGLSIEVDALPNSIKSGAVGVFDSISLALDKNQAREGDGIVARLILQGLGNSEKMRAPALRLPDGLTSYESQTISKNIGSGKTETIFEYIIQGVRPGSYMIDPQEFTYFDSAERVLKKLYSETAQVTIYESNFASDKEPTKKIVNDSEEEVEENIPELIPLFSGGGRIHAVPGMIIPWHMFFSLIVAVLMSILIVHFWRYISNRNRIRSTKKEYALSTAVAQLEYLKKAELQKRGLYNLFMQLFAQREECSTLEMNEDRIIKQLTEAGLSPSLIEEWNSFFSKCAAMAFTSQTTVTEKTLYKEAEQWLSRFKEYFE